MTGTAASSPRPSTSDSPAVSAQRRMRPGQVITTVLVLAGALFGLTRAGWITAQAPGLAGGSAEHTVNGQTASPAVVALIAVVLAAAFAAAITRGWVRTVIAAIAALCAAGAGASIVPVLLDPAAAARGGVATETGVAGQAITAQLTAWPLIALALAVLLTVACAALVVIARRTPARGSDRSDRYARSAGRGSGTQAAGNTVAQRSDAADWDALSRGEDPS